MNFKTRNLLNDLVMESGITDIIESYSRELTHDEVYDKLFENIKVEIKENRKSVSIVYTYNNYKTTINNKYYTVGDLLKSTKHYLINTLIMYFNNHTQGYTFTKAETIQAYRAWDFVVKVSEELEITEEELNKL